jgi:hypothetical protein
MAYSGQKKIAYQAGFDDALYGRARDNPYDNTTVPGSHAAYEEGYDIGLESDEPPRGAKGDPGDPGPIGPQGLPGVNGVNGTNGLDGSSVHTGTGAPSAMLGNDGDVYIDADNGDVYDKAGGTWSLQGSPLGMAQATRTDTDGGSPETIYRGTANPGTATSTAAWRCEEITIAADGDVTILFADGNDSYDNVWDNRASLSYS